MICDHGCDAFYITRRLYLEQLLYDEVEELTQWFFEAMDDPEKSRILLSKSSLVALAVWRYGGNGDLTTTSHSPPQWTCAALLWRRQGSRIELRLGAHDAGPIQALRRGGRG